MTQEATLDYRNHSVALDAETEGVFFGLSTMAWVKIAIVTVLMVATFRFNLVRLWLKTNPFYGQPNWRHSVLVPLIGLYYLFVHRDELLATKTYTAWSGLGILIAGILLFAYGIYPGQNDFIKDIGMVVALFGVVTLLCGWGVMKIAWFPIVFLVCAIPWPELVYSYVASPLQRLAATVAVLMLKTGGVDAFHNGTKIVINGKNNVWRTLNVAEACAGLRSLMTFISVAAAVAFLSIRPMWQKIIVTVMAIPIAVFCNVMRVSGQGFLDRTNHEWSEGFAHQFAGVAMLIPGFFFILFVGWLLDQVFIEVVDDREVRRKKAALVKPSKPVEWTLPGSALVESQAGAAVATDSEPVVVAKTTVAAPVASVKAPVSAAAASTATTPKPAGSPSDAQAKPAAKAGRLAAVPAVKAPVKTAGSPAAPAPAGLKPTAKPAAAPPVAPKIAQAAKPAAPVARAATAAKAPGVKVASPAAGVPAPAVPKPAIKPVVKPTAAPAVGMTAAPAIKAPAAKPPVAPGATPVSGSSPAAKGAVKSVAQPAAPRPAAGSATAAIKPPVAPQSGPETTSQPPQAMEGT